MPKPSDPERQPAEDPWALYKAARGHLSGGQRGAKRLPKPAFDSQEEGPFSRAVVRLGSSGPGAFKPDGFRVSPAGLLVPALVVSFLLALGLL